MTEHGGQTEYRIVGALTHREAMAERARLATAIASGCRRINLAGLTRFDSSALAVILAGLRDSGGATSAIELIGLPDPLRELARLYGLEELLRSAMTGGQASPADVPAASATARATDA